MKIKITTFIILFVFSLTVKAQDPIFTQYFMVPETLNPGFTGFLETTNAGILHRTQWPDLNFRVDSDFGFINTWLENANSGIGVNVLNHREKFTNYNFTQVNFNYAYRVQLNDDWFFRPAIEMGFGNKSYGFQNIVLEDQINIGQGTINTSSVDPLLLNEKVTFFDFSAGMLFNNEEAWFGLSLKHINKPNIAFSNTGNVPLGMFFSANAGYEFLLGDYIDITYFPYETKMLLTSNYMHQGQYSRFDLGTGLVFKKFFFGVSAATNPGKKADNSHFLTSVNAFGGLQYEHFKFGYSHDFSTSKIGKTGGIYELSVTYQFDLEVKCFGCPNYY
ncbi:PorP/SprF family type IX secretion system membrane protein [Flavobacterium sp. LB1P62]|uniref:PorP/SprF family type IX secretion system membrane protein n=1 Tax=Flavobacterium sp. LB1P62 TaxID=3401715 RepID=UPI003AAF65FB